ncbi:hypothetical protein CDO52_06245 [Nocardiopsis gilva YIM 90087]|uniref:MoaB/Mog domain-containing protein n=1 Tax=Nocardiopsis gilva YIM 90087 TaxID=1235441 RepID=A0A223S2T7_9ACTN|nr:hypothetical protein CDO52_06245 [Nocardiopsis gilva YIM 90087]
MSGHAAREGADRAEGADAAAPVRRVAVITASNRAAAGVYPDRSGPILVEELERAGFAAEGPWVVPDGAPVAEALRRALAEGYDAAITTGGTGLTPGTTPRRPPARCWSAKSRASRGAALGRAGQGRSHGTALPRPGGIAERGGHRMLVVNLPGSGGACATAWRCSGRSLDTPSTRCAAATTPDLLRPTPALAPVHGPVSPLVVRPLFRFPTGPFCHHIA